MLYSGDVYCWTISRMCRYPYITDKEGLYRVLRLVQGAFVVDLNIKFLLILHVYRSTNIYILYAAVSIFMIVFEGRRNILFCEVISINYLIMQLLFYHYFPLCLPL